MSVVEFGNIGLVRETEDEMVFAHKRLAHFGLALLGLLLAASLSDFPWHHGFKRLTDLLWGLLGFSMALVGVLGLVWREELRMDLVKRTCTWKKGYLFHANSRELSLDSLKGVELQKTKVLFGRSGPYMDAWELALIFSSAAPVNFALLVSEGKAHLLLERISGKLKVPPLLYEHGRHVSVPLGPR